MKKLFLLLSVSVVIVSCGPSAEEIAARKKHMDDSLVLVKSIKESIVVADTEKKVVEVVSRHWDSKEVKLPVGIVDELNCTPDNTKDNYVTIKKSDGISTIVRDIDEDLYLNLRLGDIIE